MRIAMLAIHVGLAVALLLGLSILTHIGPGKAALAFHVSAGSLVVLGSLTIYLRLRQQQHERTRAAGIVLVALIVGAGNGLLAIGGTSNGILHLAIMLLAVYAAESLFARLKRES